LGAAVRLSRVVHRVQSSDPAADATVLLLHSGPEAGPSHLLDTLGDADRLRAPLAQGGHVNNSHDPQCRRPLTWQERIGYRSRDIH
jgi:hypothetical protein